MGKEILKKFIKLYNIIKWKVEFMFVKWLGIEIYFIIKE